MFKTQIKFIEDRIRHHRWHATNSLKIQQQLGWESSETFHSGMAKTVEWCLRNLDWINKTLNGDYKKFDRFKLFLEKIIF